MNEYIFENFDVNEENCGAYNMAVQFAEDGYHKPLCIFGAEGRGKTHLLHAVRDRIIRNHRDANVILTSPAEMQADIAAASSPLLRDAMEAHYRNADVILIDDVQLMTGMNGTQDYLYWILEQHTAKIMLTSSETDAVCLVNRLPRFQSLLFSGEYAVTGTPYQEQNRRAGLYGWDEDSITKLLPYVSRKPSLILLAARPGLGKTSLAASLAQYLVKTQDRTAVFFEMETTEMQFRLHNVSGSAAFRIESPRSMTVSEFRKALLQNSSDVPDFVVIDSVQCMRDASNEMPDAEILSEIIRTCKDIALKMHLTILLLSRLPQTVEQRFEKRPKLSDLCVEAALRQEADAVMFLYNDFYYYRERYQREADQHGLADVCPDTECIIALNRFGETGTVYLQWHA